MNLSQPVTIQLPSFIRKNGETYNPPPFVIKELDFIIIDNYKSKVVSVRLQRFPKIIILWQGAEYDSAGDYTQAQVEARLLEKLGPDLKVGLENLFVKPASQ